MIEIKIKQGLSHLADVQGLYSRNAHSNSRYHFQKSEKAGSSSDDVARYIRPISSGLMKVFVHT